MRALITAGAVALALSGALPSLADEVQNSDGHTSLRTRSVDDAGKLLGNPANPYSVGGPSGAPVVSSVSSIASGTTQTIFPAKAAGSPRAYLSVTANGNIFCTDDGSTPVSGHWSFWVTSLRPYRATWPGFVSNGAIICAVFTGDCGPVSMMAESYP